MTNLTFSSALEMLRHGERMQRSGWNGKDMFIYLVPAAEYPAQRGAAKAWAGEDAMIPYGAYLAMKTADGTVVPWLASQTDILARDWGKYEDSSEVGYEMPQSVCDLFDAIRDGGVFSTEQVVEAAQFFQLCDAERAAEEGKGESKSFEDLIEELFSAQESEEQDEDPFFAEAFDRLFEERGE